MILYKQRIQIDWRTEGRGWNHSVILEWQVLVVWKLFTIYQQPKWRGSRYHTFLFGGNKRSKRWGKCKEAASGQYVKLSTLIESRGNQNILKILEMRKVCYAKEFGDSFAWITETRKWHQVNRKVIFCWTAIWELKYNKINIMLQLCRTLVRPHQEYCI